MTWPVDVPEGGGWLLYYPLPFDGLRDADMKGLIPDALSERRVWLLNWLHRDIGVETDVIAVRPSANQANGSGNYYIDLLFKSRDDAMLFKLTHGGAQ